MPTLYNSTISGNCYKVRLTLAQLNIRYDKVEIDVVKGHSRPPEFLAKHPTGAVPLFELDDGTVLAESNAIIHYLAEGSHLMPDSRLARNQALQWMFFEQNQHEPRIATSRYWHVVHGDPTPRQHMLPQWHEDGTAVLGMMDRHLRDNKFFLGSLYSIADIALYAYTHVANEGGFDLTPFTHIGTWLDRVRDRPGHIPITA